MCQSINDMIYAGYAEAAKAIGDDYIQYRVIHPLTALDNPLRTLKVNINPKDWTYKKAAEYGKNLYYVVADGRLLAVGDYLINPNRTLFIAGMEPLLPILAVACNRVVSLYIQNTLDDTGNGSMQLLGSAPASILQNTQSSGKMDSPYDNGQGRYLVLVPYFGYNIETNYIFVDDLGNSYNVLSNELTDLGWRIVAERVRT